MKLIEFVLTLCAMGCMLGTAAAHQYPDKPITMVVPFAPGGVNDFVGRPVALALSNILGQKVIVENHGGAGGTIGTSRVAAAAPDGYSLIVGSIGPLALAPSFYPHLSYSPTKSFSPISLLMTSPMILLVNPNVPARSVRELVKLAKDRPGQLTFGSVGTGSMTDLAGALFGTLAKVRMIHVPYQSTGAAMVDLLAGRIDLMFGPVALALPNVRAGKLRALGVTTDTRFKLFPKLPSISAAGVPGYNASEWWGILAPAKTPKSIVQMLNRDIVQILATQRIRSTYAKFGGVPKSSSPKEFAHLIARQVHQWADVIAKAHINVAR